MRALVRWLLRPLDRDVLLADLDDEYASRGGGSRLVSIGWYVAQGLHAAWTRPVSHSHLTTRGAITMGMWQDVRFSVRNLLKQRTFSVVALLTLALGIGANTAVFSVIRHVLLTPMPYRDADRVVDIWSKWKGYDKTWVSDADAIDYGTRINAFESAGAWSSGQVNLTGDGDPIRIGNAEVTPNLFDVLGATPEIGRGFVAADAVPDVPRVTIISYDLWQLRYGGAHDVLSRTISVNGLPLEIIGVMPADFQLPTDYVVDAEEPTRLWMPLKLDPQQRGSHYLNAAARLRPGASIASANAELQAHAAALVKEAQYPAEMGFGAFVLTVTDEAVGSVRPALLLVVGAVAFLLLIACTNVANLLLVRADARAREIAVRTAIGANRWRIVRQLMTEAAVLAAVAAGVGLVMAKGAMLWLVSSAGGLVPRLRALPLDATVLAFSMLVTVVTLVLFSLVPAIRTARVDLVEGLRDGSQNMTAGGARQRLRSALVVAQMALAVIMLTGAGLMLRSVWKLQHIELGFRPDHVLTVRLSLPEATYNTPEKAVQFYDELVRAVRALPRVERAGLLRVLPLGQQIGDWGLTVEGYTPPKGVGTPGDWQVASSGGPEALGEQLVEGRWLTDEDTIGREDVGLVNKAMADAYWGGRSALGGRFRMGSDAHSPWITVVGVVGNVRHNGITAPIKPKFYRPVGQFHQSARRPQRNINLVIRTTGDPMALASAARAEVRRLDPTLPVSAVRTMQDVVDKSIATPRLTGWLLSLFASLALVLAAVGIYGVLSYVVAQRRHEIGIRLAIGADRRDVLAMIVKSGLALAIGGLVVGLTGAAALSKVIASQLHDISPLDPVTFVGVAGVLLAVAFGACLLPGLQATRVSPVRALRAE